MVVFGAVLGLELGLRSDLGPVGDQSESHWSPSRSGWTLDLGSIIGTNFRVRTSLGLKLLMQASTLSVSSYHTLGLGL